MSERPEIPASPPPPRDRRRRLLLALVVLLGAVAGVLLRLWPDGERDPRGQRGPTANEMATVRARLHRELAAAGLRPGAPVYLRILKSERVLQAWLRAGGEDRLFRSYPICHFSGDLGPKQREGDLQAPEGLYSVSRRQLNPHSSYHLAFNIGYPNAYDRAHGRTGSALMVHGSCVSIGCFAMTDARIEEIYALVEDALRGGQPAVPVHIFPFAMTPEAMTKAAGSPHLPFWRELEPAWTAFERDQLAPRVRVSGRRYIVRAGTQARVGQAAGR